MEGVPREGSNRHRKTLELSSMSETVSQTLKESVMESRAAQDVATASIQSLENKRNQLWNTRKIDWKTNMRLSELILRIDKIIAENNLNKDFDEIVLTSN